jgi:hypothetical protein
MGNWKQASIRPKNDDTILVSWINSDDIWQGPYRAYYCPEDDKYFAVDCIMAIPLLIDIWSEIEEFPE